MAFHRGSAAPGEQPEALIETSCDLVRAHHASASRGKLDGKRDPVETPAELRDRRRGLRVEFQGASCLLGALGEELDRIRGQDLLGCRALARKRERPHHHHALTTNPEPLTSGREDRHARARRHERGDELRGRVEEMLAVVEDDE
jgi:hypothetical protein